MNIKFKPILPKPFKRKPRVFIICSVRGMDAIYKSRLEKYAQSLEALGCIVYFPHRDTNQNESGLNICLQNRRAIKWADEVHIFYSGKSQGTHFDLGMAFMSRKKIKVVENEQYGEGKSYPRMIEEWQELG